MENVDMFKLINSNFLTPGSAFNYSPGTNKKKSTVIFRHKDVSKTN